MSSPANLQSHTFTLPTFPLHNEPTSSATDPPSSSTTTTPIQEHPSQPTPTSSRGRPRTKRRYPSRRYFTPPSRVPSPVSISNNDLASAFAFTLDVDTAPQDPDIFADAETDYFSSAERADGPRAYRRSFFDAVGSVEQSGRGEGHRGIEEMLRAK